MSNSKQVICIQCHNNPEQINELISCFPERVDFIVHVDKKSDIENQIVHKENVRLSERIDVRWGTFSQVEATLKMFEMLNARYQYVHLISGNDFIIKNPKAFLDFFDRNDTEYIQCNKLEKESCSWTGGGEDRYSVYYPQWMIKRPTEVNLHIVRVAYREFVMRTKLFKRKKFPVSEFYGGSSWFSLTGKMITWMMDYIKKNPEYIKFFKHGICSDEVFFSTLAKISPFSKNIANRSLRFMIWNGTTSGGPKELGKDDIEKMKKSECLFARKFVDMDTIKMVERFVWRL